MIARAVALAGGESITADDVLLTTWNAGYEGLGPSQAPAAGGLPLAGVNRVGEVGSFKEFKATLLDVHERAYLQRLLARTQGNITRAAAVSGLWRVHLRSMLKKYGL